MAKYIKNGTLYKIRGMYRSRFVVIDNEEYGEARKELFREVAKWIINGYPVGSVVEILADGTTPRVKVLSDKNFKRILREMQKEA